MMWLKFLSFSFFKSFATSPPHLYYGRPYVLTPIGHACYPLNCNVQYPLANCCVHLDNNARQEVAVKRKHDWYVT